MSLRWSLLVQPGRFVVVLALGRLAVAVLLPEVQGMEQRTAATRIEVPPAAGSAELSEADITAASRTNVFHPSRRMLVADELGGVASGEPDPPYQEPVLLGTTVSQTESRALVSWNGAAPVRMQVDEVYAGFRLVTVGRGEVTLMYGDSAITLNLRRAHAR